MSRNGMSRALRSSRARCFAARTPWRLEQVARDDLVDEPGRFRVRRGDRLPVGAQPQREFHAGEPGQPLRAAGARNDAEQHLGLADAYVCGGDAEMTRHRDLVAAAERVAVDGGDDRLGRVLDTAQQGVRPRRALERLLARFQRVEDLDVRAGDERRSRTDDHDGVRVGIG